MKQAQNDLSALPINALSEVPQPKADAKRITGLTRHSGKVTGYRLSDGRIVNRAEGVALAKQGKIEGVGVSRRKDTEYLKSLPDSTEDNNLSNLPTVHDEE